MNMIKIVSEKRILLELFALILILSIAFFLRTININWDENYNFHPDERAIIMFTIDLRMPSNLNEFLSIDSPLNPKFFAYGNFPLYLLKIISEIASKFDPTLNDYGRIHMVGRLISAFFDTLTVLIVYLIGKKANSFKTGLFSSAIYTFTFLPIQLSHFYAVDTILNFFMILLIFILITYYKNPKKIYSVLMGTVFGFSLATKISALPIVSLVIFLFVYKAYQNKKDIKKIAVHLLLFSFFSISFFIALQPYVLIDFPEFLKQTNLQTQMSKDPFVFPFTLQYVNKIRYLYEFKNIFLWGAGPFITILAILGFAKILKGIKKENNFIYIVLASYFTIYFLLFGSFAVGWMRYMLPIYPLIALFSGLMIIEFTKKIKFIALKYIFFLLIIILGSIHTATLISIYRERNPRIIASEWINKNIPYGSTIAIEHWDDSLPIFGFEKYKSQTLNLYEPETNEKWAQIHQILESSEYIFIASNRLYKPLQKLTDCQNLPPGKCYYKTSKYYDELFNGNLGFAKIKEFTNYPNIPFLNINIIDDDADESFTVYDHPKIIVFKNIRK